MHRKALGSRRHPALNGLGVNEGEALEERKLAPMRSPAQRSEFLHPPPPPPRSLLLLVAGDTVQQRGWATPPCFPGPHPSTSRSLLRTQPYPQALFFPGTHPCPGFCLLVASPHCFRLYETFILQGDCRGEYYFFLLSNLTKERENKSQP